MFSTGEISGVDEVVAAEYLDHQGLDGNELCGADGFVAVVRAARHGYAQLQVDVIELEIAGDTVHGRLHWTGVRADGTEDERDTAEVLRVADGRAVEHWGTRL